MPQDQVGHRDLPRQIRRAQRTASGQDRTCPAHQVPEILEGIGPCRFDHVRLRLRNPEPRQQHGQAAARFVAEAAQPAPVHRPPREIQRRLDVIVAGRIGNRMAVPHRVGGAALRPAVEAARGGDGHRHGVTNLEAGPAQRPGQRLILADRPRRQAADGLIGRKRHSEARPGSDAMVGPGIVRARIAARLDLR